MATIRIETPVAVAAADAWSAIRDWGAVHRRQARGFVTDVKLDAGDRVVTFANGYVVRERLVTVDDAARRLAYSATSGRASHHNASFEVLPAGERACRVVWLTDLLPDEVAPAVAAMMEAGSAAMKRTLEEDLSARTRA